MNNKTVICILGATATGKSGLSLSLANRINGEVISADSMQIYRGLDIGTAKISKSQMQGITHHMLDIVAPTDNFSVAQYCTMAQACIEDIFDRCKVPMLVGGTGLYIDSLLSGLEFAEMTVDESYREQLHDLAAKQGNETVWKQLNEVDPALAQTLHPNNLRRVIRALEVYHVCGQPMSEMAKIAQREPKYPCIYIGLRYADRQLLYKRINERVDHMLEQGLLSEIERVLNAGVPRDCQALQAIGYKEFLPYFDGMISLDEAVETAKRNSRRYAKRQYTWFKRNEHIHWIDVDLENSLERAEKILGLI
jgi:tRNA dimethylallyltransferase